jgi:electron transfer flavoprotein beta subunit
MKQVPDTNEVSMNPETNTLNRAGVPSIVNPFDKFALEMALRLKEANGGEVTVITMGPKQAEEALKECYAIGADHVCLCCDRKFAGSDTLATSYTVSHIIKKIGEYDLILCGKQAIDGDTAQVGTGIAEWLGLPQVVCGVDIEVDGENVIVTKELDVTLERISMKMPAVVAVSKALDTRNPNIRRRLDANRMEIPALTADDLQTVGLDPALLGLKGSPTKVKKVFVPTPRAAGDKYEGLNPEDAAARIVEFLENEHVI